jgi:hypothetical protein
MLAFCLLMLSQAEIVALLEQRYRYETTLKQMEDQVSSAQQQLRQTNERSAKLRQHHERQVRTVQQVAYSSKRQLQPYNMEMSYRQQD